MWISYILHRLIYAVKQYPQRAHRAFNHLFFIDTRIWYLYRNFNQSPTVVLIWCLDAIWLTLDLLIIPDLYDLLSNLIKRTKPLSEQERTIILSIYGPGLPLHIIRKDRHTWLGPPIYRMVYVSFLTINYWKGPLSSHLLIHEVMHILQYHGFGSRYINHALWAQHVAGGYKYGGLEGLSQAMASPYGIHALNFEQMAEAMEDYSSVWSQEVHFCDTIPEPYRSFLNEVTKVIRNSGG